MRESARKLFSSFFPLFEIWPSLWFLRLVNGIWYLLSSTRRGPFQNYIRAYMSLSRTEFSTIMVERKSQSLLSCPWRQARFPLGICSYFPVRGLTAGGPHILIASELIFFVTNEKMSVSGDRCSFEILDWTFGAGSLSPVGICWAIFFLLYNRGSWVVIVQSPVADKRGIFYRRRVVPKL